jgi:hypothetical protein
MHACTIDNVIRNPCISLLLVEGENIKERKTVRGSIFDCFGETVFCSVAHHKVLGSKRSPISDQVIVVPVFGVGLKVYAR